MAYKKRSERKRSYGGKADTGNMYNAAGSPAAKAVTAKSDGFKKGGMIEGKMGKSHLAKRARGGSITSNGSPFSSARSVSGPGSVKGSPGEQAPVEG